MEQVVRSAAQWTVLVRSGGDALAVRASGSGLELGFLGIAPGFTPPEIESWLTELIGMAGTSGGDSPVMSDPASSLPIPRTLHQALSGLLFYEAELWGADGERPPCTVACLAAGARVAFGWTGSGQVEIRLEGQPFEPEWVLVRDQEGRHARAFVTDARLQLEARVNWPASVGGTVPPEGEIEARWPGLAMETPEAVAGPEPDQPALCADDAAVETQVEPASSRNDAPEPRPGRQRGFWHFRSWMDRLAGLRTREDVLPELAQPEPIAHDVPGVPDLLPEPESAVAEAPATEEATPAPEVATAPAIEEAALEPEVADTPTIEVATPAPLVAEAPTIEVATPAPEVAETPVVIEATPRSETESEAGGPVASEMRVTGCELSVDPFDLGPLAPFEPESAVTEPVAQLESVPAPGPAAMASVVTSEPPPASEPTIGEAAASPDSPPSVPPEDLATGAAEAGALRIRRRPVARHPAWPEPEESVVSDGRPLWQHRWFIFAVVVVLFAAGWFLGRVDFSRGARDITSTLKAIGFGPARYDVTVTSRPSGAWIAVDGVDQARRTPATLELKPGTHEVVLSFSGVGGSSHTVNGRRGQRVALDVELWGSLKVAVPAGGVPVSVAVDGVPRGYAPLDVERLQPGIHRLQFSGPGVAPWEQTVEVYVNRTVELAAQPVASPATGLLEVRATLADETGSEPLTGAQVWIDGQPRGVTPLKLELPRGPHSIRVRHRDEEGPVQVIELPGGNLRYATIELGLNLDAPRLVAALPERIPVGRPTVLSASLDGARDGDVREMWLHVRTPEGAWRRYPMTLMNAPGGLVGVTVFPTVLFDARGRAAWYVSASTPMGDEYFTEIRPAQAATRP
jgi:hypothetical protein